jgi:shikimate dehydrogenase
LRGKRVLLLGTGGAGKSIAYAVAIEHPAELALHNRSQERAIALGDRLRLELPEVAITIGSDDAREFDVVINATSLGLNDDDPLPLRVETLQPGTLVCEAVMNEGDTRLLVEARKRGCVVHHGEHMLQGQIVEIARFMGIEFDTQTMKYMI